MQFRNTLSIITLFLSILAFTHTADAQTTKPAGTLVIVKAVWGDLPDGDKTDVTAIVRDQVDGDHLKIQASNDNFGDPASGITKKLQVEYKLNGVIGVKMVDEDQVLSIPQVK